MLSGTTPPFSRKVRKCERYMHCLDLNILSYDLIDDNALILNVDLISNIICVYLQAEMPIHVHAEDSAA